MKIQALTNTEMPAQHLRGTGVERGLDNIDVKDLALVLSIPVVLILVHVLVPEQVKSLMAFRYSEYNLVGLYTSAYVHASFKHLFGNISAYLVAVAYIYWLCIGTDSKPWFRATFILFLVVLPPLSTATGSLMLHTVLPDTSAPTRGFSGVASGFAGFLFIAVVDYVRRRHSLLLALNLGIGLIILFMAEIHVTFSGGFDPLVLGVSAVGIGATVVRPVWNEFAGTGIRDLPREEFVRLVPFVGGILLLIAFIPGMFPGQLVKNDSFVNIFSHLAGFVWGGVLAATSLSIIRFRK